MEGERAHEVRMLAVLSESRGQQAPRDIDCFNMKLCRQRDNPEKQELWYLNGMIN